MDARLNRFTTHVRVGFPDGCWRWKGAKTVDGYGTFGGGGLPFTARAHRVSWELFVGPIPEGAHVLHRCDNPGCVNPEHLWLGTAKDNSDDKYAKGRAKPRGKAQPARR